MTLVLPDTPEDSLARARALGGEGRWDAAASLLEAAQARWPEALRLATDRIEALVRAYRPEAAAEAAAALEAAFPGHPRVALFLAEFAARRGGWAEACDRFAALAARGDRQAREVAANPHYRQAVLNRHGILAGSRRLPLLTHADLPGAAAAEDAPEPQGYVFVSGMPRSGTTALGHLLNHSERVALYTELHNYYYAYAPASFAPALVAQKVRARPAVTTPMLTERARTAAWLGDKRPLFHYGLPQTLQAMAGRRVTVFHILRPVLQVAASYQTRAANPADQWDPLKDIRICIDEMNVMHRFLLERAEAGTGAGAGDPDHRLVFVDYHRVFADPGCAAGLFGLLDIEMRPALGAAVAAFQGASTAVMAKPRSVDPGVRDRLARDLDGEAARGVARLTGIDILAGL